MTAPVSVPGLPARRAALQLIDAVLRRGQPLEGALGGTTRGLNKAEDRALAHAIASETLRRLPDIDALIDSATRQKLPGDAKARAVLRIALVQALTLGTPAHAAIATALPLVSGGPRRLVHGVLGALLRKGAALPDPPHLPEAAAARWAAAWGDAMVEAARRALASPPPLDLTLKDHASTHLWAERLGGTSLAPGHVRIGRGQDVRALPGFAEGAWWIQNISAALPAQLLGAGEGRSALDLCAAPGGKTLQLAAAGWNVVSVDRDGTRLARLADNLKRTGLSAQVIEADALSWTPEATFDAILLDAPCSATGIFARHPDVLHRVRDPDIDRLAEVQARLLARAAGWLAPEGRLVYATCSLEPSEGEDIAGQAAGSGLVLDPVSQSEVFEGVACHHRGWVRILPEPGRDGFFIARFRRA